MRGLVVTTDSWPTTGAGRWRNRSNRESADSCCDRADQKRAENRWAVKGGGESDAVTDRIGQQSTGDDERSEKAATDNFPRRESCRVALLRWPGWTRTREPRSQISSRSAPTVTALSARGIAQPVGIDTADDAKWIEAKGKVVVRHSTLAVATTPGGECRIGARKCAAGCRACADPLTAVYGLPHGSQSESFSRTASSGRMLLLRNPATGISWDRRAPGQTVWRNGSS
jgi:hypothetical protein